MRAAMEVIPQDHHAAVIYAYHRIGEDAFPEMSIRTGQFRAHISELMSGSYNILSLSEVVKSQKNEDKLLERTVVLTFDGGHSSIRDRAIPLMLENNIPFTLFISTDHIDRNTSQYMKWDDLKKLAKNKLVTFGIHPASYTRLAREPESEIARQVNKARTRFREELGFVPQFFSYPFGEYSAFYRDFIAGQGFEAAVGQQSGTSYIGSDFFALPRFPMTESYGSLERFRMTANALPLPVTDIFPQDMDLDSNTPSIGFTIDTALNGSLNKLSCFASDQEKPAIEAVGLNRIELRLQNPFQQERARINCTMPGPQQEAGTEPRWRWFGMLMTVPFRAENIAMD